MADPQEFASKARDLQALRDAVADAASVSGGLWFSYIFVLFYLLIAAGGVTHADLFLEHPVKLPFLNVDLPLKGFFWLGPAIFLIVHTYVLLHFVLLAGKVGDFDRRLREQIADDETRADLRRQLPSNIFVQFLAGPREVRGGVLGFLLRTVAWISLVFGPIALLVFFELQFLPYHDEAISWWHRIAVVLDIVLLWILWPPVVKGQQMSSVIQGGQGWLGWRIFRCFWFEALNAVSVAAVLLVTIVGTFPGEKTDVLFWWAGPFFTWSRIFLIAGEVDPAERKPKSLWSNVLVLPGFDAIDRVKFDSDAKIEAASETISLRARHLEGAVLSGAKLRRADFTGAFLQRAKLDKADLRQANFKCGDVKDPNVKDPGHQHPTQCAYLEGASVVSALLQGASLDGAQLQGASLKGAQLQGASLMGAQLQGASLDFAQLQGASLQFAQLQGAWLNDAQLLGASLDHAWLQGASVVSARLQGASLDGAQLQGASLNGADLEGASLDGVFVWRADARDATWKGTRVSSPNTDAMSVPEFGDLKETIFEQILEGDRRRDAMERIQRALDPKPLEGEDEMADIWEDQADYSPDRDKYEESLAKIWREIGCAAEGAPYVARALLTPMEYVSPFAEVSPHPAALARVLPAIFRGFRFTKDSPYPPAFAKAFLDEEHCPGARGLSEEDKATLKELAAKAPSPAPSQTTPKH